LVGGPVVLVGVAAVVGLAMYQTGIRPDDIMEWFIEPQI